MIKFLIIGVAVFSILLVGCSSNASNNKMESESMDSNTMEADNMQESTNELPNSGMFQLNTEESVIHWHGEKIVGNSHDGTIKLSNGMIELQDKNLVRGMFVIDMTTIKDSEGSDMLEKHLKSQDFFDVEKYPESKIILKDIIKKDTMYQVIGDLTILDTTHEIVFPPEIKFDGQNVMVNAEFSIDRTKWNIIYGSGSFFKEMGDGAIRNEINYELDLVFDLE